MNRMAAGCLFVLTTTAVACGGPAVDEPRGDEPSLDGTARAADECAQAKLSSAAARPVALLSKEWLDYLAPRMPCVADASLRAILESADTVWYDKTSIIPGYQDSFGDGTQLPVGMRPNTIDASMINLAVPGGHGQIFVERGVFHFPFGRPIGAKEKDVAVVNFWKLPRDEAGALLPVVWWKYQPSGYTRRIDWVFPKDTVFGELMFVIGADGHYTPFEIRTRTRTLSGWTVDVHRPFPTADDLAAALEAKQASDPAVAEAADVTALVARLRDPATLQAAKLSTTHFVSAFPTLQGARDVLPGIADASVLRALLLETGFRSAKGAVWKESGGLRAWAPTTQAGDSIVPRGYNGGFFDVSDATCSTCHMDAGRPFRDWYSNIVAYGELWGADETFTWHPFQTSAFVDGKGKVVNFNNDNRKLRQDFVSAGVIVKYDPAKHAKTVYSTIPRAWKKYVY